MGTYSLYVSFAERNGVPEHNYKELILLGSEHCSENKFLIVDFSDTSYPHTKTYSKRGLVRIKTAVKNFVFSPYQSIRLYQNSSDEHNVAWV